MDQTLRAPWRAMIRYVVFGVGVAAALVLLSLVLGARPASAAEPSAATAQQTQPAQQRGLVGGVVGGLGSTVQGVASGVGNVVEGVVDPVRKAVAPVVPAAPTPAAPAPVAPAPAAAPVPVAPVPAAPTSAHSQPAPAAPAHTQ
ncbi:hypothetical protein Q7F20_17010, partial [Curtobacterium sp. A7_M15]|uniref:hypothetical protein n=1 Tax=Curtobacterium sp. A7_M15 TaxID=3065241 RepID=UPI002737E56B